MRRILLVPLGLGACSPALALAPPQTEPQPAQVAEPVLPVSASAPKPERPSVPTLQRPARTACSLESADPGRSKGIPVFFGESTSSGIRLAPDSRVQVFIPLEDGEPWTVEIHRGGIHALARCRPGGFSVFLRQPRLLQGYLVALPSMPFSVQGIVGASLALEALAPRADATQGHELVTAALCQDISVDPGSSTVSSALAPADRALRKGYLQPEVFIPLSVEATSAAVAEISTTALDQQVEVIAQAKGKVRIRWERSDSILFGWIPATRVTARPTTPRVAALSLAEASSHGILGLLSTGPQSGVVSGILEEASQPEPVLGSAQACRTLDLYARINNKTYRIGSIDSTTAFRVLTRAEVFSAVEFKQPPIVGSGFEWQVATADLASCGG